MSLFNTAVMCFFLKLANFHIYLWLLWVFVAAWRLPLVVAVRGYLLCGAQASHCRLLLLWPLGSRSQAHMDFSNSSSSLAYSVKKSIQISRLPFCLQKSFYISSPDPQLKVSKTVFITSPQSDPLFTHHMHLLCSVSVTPPTWPSMTKV